MKQTLNLRLGQQLSLTPQLQQSLKFLQMSTLDLQQEIQQVLDSNMMLEIDEDNTNTGDIEQFDTKNDNLDQQTSEGSQTDIPDELPIDSSWEDVYENSFAVNGEESQSSDFEPQNTKSATLQEHLLWQLELAYFSERDKEIALTLIDSINEDGYLVEPLTAIYEGLKEQLENLDDDEVVAVLHHIQTFDPAGVGAENLGDCLRLQLRQLSDDTPYKTQALTLVTDYLDNLAAQEQEKIMRDLNLNALEFAQIIALIKTLDPKPGAKIHETDYEYVVPDVYVNKYNGEWIVLLNQDIAPKLRINPYYSTLINKTQRHRRRIRNARIHHFQSDHTKIYAHTQWHSGIQILFL